MPPRHTVQLRAIVMMRSEVISFQFELGAFRARGRRRRHVCCCHRRMIHALMRVYWHDASDIASMLSHIKAHDCPHGLASNTAVHHGSQQRSRNLLRRSHRDRACSPQHADMARLFLMLGLRMLSRQVQILVQVCTLILSRSGQICESIATAGSF